MYISDFRSGNAGTAADSSGGIAAFRGKEDPGTDERSGQRCEEFQRRDERSGRG